MKVDFCIPVFNDWASASQLLRLIDDIAPQLGEVRVTFIDDASTEDASHATWTPPTFIRSVSILMLRRNLSHQRAIAVGLTHLHTTRDPDLIVVMDGDGEDRPSDVPTLTQHCIEGGCRRVVFAERAKRSEGGVFRAGYLVYRSLHQFLVGQEIRVGNFSVVPRSAVERLVAVSELWNHYAAAVFVARIPHSQVPIDRGTRLAGESKMNFVSLVIHGLSAISVHSEKIAVRTLVFVGFLCAVLVLALGLVVGIRLGTDLAVPGWATSTLGFILIALLNLSLLSVVVAVFVLRGRSDLGFIPLRDHSYFKGSEVQLFAK